MINSWYQGKLTAEKLNWWHPDVKVNFGGIATPGYGHYTMATFDAWIGDLALYNLNDMEWEYSPFDGGCIGEWRVSSVEVKTTGAKTGPIRAMNKFFMKDGLITEMELVTSGLGQLEELSSSPNVGIVRALIGDWAAGTLAANKEKYFAPDAVIDGYSPTCPGFGKYGLHNFEQWMDELTQYNFPGMAWTFSAGPNGSVYGEWSCDDLNVKKTGGSIGATGGVNKWILENGMVKEQLLMRKHAAQMDALFA